MNNQYNRGIVHILLKFNKPCSEKYTFRKRKKKTGGFDMKRKIIAIMLVVSCAVLTACSNGSSNTQVAQETEVSTKTVETVDSNELAKKAYENLNEAADTTDTVMGSVYSAWHFSIFSGDDYTLNFNSGAYDFAKEIGVDSGTASTAMSKVLSDVPSFARLGESYYGQGFAEPVYCIKAVLLICDENGISDDIEKKLSDAKEEIKQISDADPNYKNLDELKKYYSEVQSYYEFAVSPSGSYKECGSTIENYRSNLKTFKNDLSFDLE